MNLGAPLLRWLTLLSPVCCCLFSARGILHFFQLESYQFPGYFRSLKRNRVHSLLPGLCVTVTVLVLLYGFDVLALRGEARWTGILAAVEDPEGKCYVGYFSTVKRKMRRADLRRDQNQKEPLTKQNPTGDSWNEVQERLDQYAKKMKLRELPLTIGGEIEEDIT